MADQIQIRPQEGPQEAFLSSPADIVIYGGQAGGGKTFGLLIEPIRHLHVKGFTPVIFRRDTTQIRNPGGLWDESTNIYPHVAGVPRESSLEWRFPNWRLKMMHLEHEKDVHGHQGAQYAFIGLDEVTHFTEKQFWYLLSRNRSVCGVKPYVRCTCNPDPDSFVAKLIGWWIGDDGYPIMHRSGVIRWFFRVSDTLHWYDSKEEALEALLLTDPEATEHDIKSLTFIPASVHDNKKLLEKDPGYLGNLKALSLVERERLLGGNWKIRPAAGLLFKREWFEIVDAAPKHNIKTARGWDLAATEPGPSNPDPDYTAGVKITKDIDGIYYIEHATKFRATPQKVETRVKNTASQDTEKVSISLFQDPGQAGKYQANQYIKVLSGYNVRANTVTKDKITNASPFSAQCEAGNVKIVRGPWNDEYLDELHAFDGSGKIHDDYIDSSVAAFDGVNKSASIDMKGARVKPRD